MIYREATIKDLPEIVDLLIDDKLGSKRENNGSDISVYKEAFNKIDEDPRHFLIVAEENSEVIAVLQLNYLFNLTYKGGTRAQIEGVRVKDSYRGKGVGKLLLEYCINKAKKDGAVLVQLTSDKQRPEAIKFYENFGFKASHEGMKLFLN